MYMLTRVLSLGVGIVLCAFSLQINCLVKFNFGADEVSLSPMCPLYFS